MRAVLATALSILLAMASIAHHVHVGMQGADECAACVASGRGAEPAKSQTPDVAPQVVTVDETVLRPGLAPVLGAPLGAIPGQSPPRA